MGNWNRLDFIIVVTGLLYSFPILKTFRVMRVMRVLRPLRAINRLPELKLIIDAIFQSVMKLATVSVVAVFFVTIYSIIGIQFWRGLLHFRCYHNRTGELAPGSEVEILCGEGARECGLGYVCEDRGA